MRYVQRYVLSLGLLATGVTAATYHFAQIDTIGACGKGGWSLTVVIGPTCPPGRDAMLVVMLAGLILGLVGATIYAARGTSDDDPAKVHREPFYLGNLRFWPTLALAFVVAEFVHPDKEQFRPGPEVIAIGIGSLLVVTALGVKTAQWWEGLGADPPPPAIVDQRAGAGRAKALAAALALLAMLAGAYGAYALQRSVGPTGPRVR